MMGVKIISFCTQVRQSTRSTCRFLLENDGKEMLNVVFWYQAVLANISMYYTGSKEEDSFMEGNNLTFKCRSAAGDYQNVTNNNNVCLKN
jgi:hypothetical protein